MRKVMSAALVGVAVLLALAGPSDAGGRRHWHGGTRVFVGVGPAFYYGGYYPYWYRPYYYPYYHPYYYPPYVYTPPVVVQDPPVYVQQPQAQQPAPAATEPGPPPAGFWYYCASAGEYYPRVASCAEAWIKVPPRQE
jgi:hypothetical protein